MSIEILEAAKRDWKLATYAAGVTAAMEFPISQYYKTVPATSTIKRMGIASSMAFIAVIIGSALMSRNVNK